MPRPSSIDKLDRRLREEIGRLRQGGRSIDDILAKLRELDPEAEISRSALGRHVQRIDRIGEQLRKSRAVAEGIARALGDKPADELTRANIEMVQHGVFELLADASDAGSEGGEAARKVVRNPMAAKLLAETIERLTKASRHNLEFVSAVEKRVKTEAAAAASAVAQQRGISAETRDAIVAGILGVKRT